MQPKVLYISNVDLQGTLIPGVTEKIRGQRAAFFRNGFDISVLYPEAGTHIVIEHGNGKKVTYKGARAMDIQPGILKKVKQHLQLAWFGSMNFDECVQDIAQARYDAVYLRFYLPGKDLIRFLRKLRKQAPGTKVLLEYPTLNVGPLMKTDKARWVSYLINKKRIAQMNELADYIITLTKDQSLFGKPALFMPNGFDFNSLQADTPKSNTDKLILLGVASDCANYHGYDKIILGLQTYLHNNPPVDVEFRIVSSLAGHNMAALKKLAVDTGVDAHVVFCGLKSKSELLTEYKKAHIGVGTLALHRIGLLDNYSLKHREYAASGLPFIMSLGDDAFEDTPFVFTVERDELPVNIGALVHFYQQLREQYPDYPSAFRQSMERKLSWDAQMQAVFSAIRNPQNN